MSNAHWTWRQLVKAEPRLLDFEAEAEEAGRTGEPRDWLRYLPMLPRFNELVGRQAQNPELRSIPAKQAAVDHLADVYREARRTAPPPAPWQPLGGPCGPDQERRISPSIQALIAACRG